jgi:hypothetical protein
MSCISAGASRPIRLGWVDPDRAYRFLDHARYLDTWFDALDLRRT